MGNNEGFTQHNAPAMTEEKVDWDWQVYATIIIAAVTTFVVGIMAGIMLVWGWK